MYSVQGKLQCVAIHVSDKALPWRRVQRCMVLLVADQRHKSYSRKTAPSLLQIGSGIQSAVMHGKTIARSHSVLMHVCMPGDCIQLSIEGPTDIGAGCALLAGRQQSVAWFETGFGFLARFWV